MLSSEDSVTKFRKVYDLQEDDLNKPSFDQLKAKYHYVDQSQNLSQHIRKKPQLSIFHNRSKNSTANLEVQDFLR